MRTLKGYIWFIQIYGIKRLIQYEKYRREGHVIDYSKIFSATELDELEQAGFAPWVTK